MNFLLRFSCNESVFIISSFLLMFVFAFSVNAQNKFLSIDEIPLPSGNYIPVEIPLLIPFREEISHDYTDKKKIDFRFEGMAVRERKSKIWSFPEGSDLGSAQSVAFNFYQELLNPGIYYGKGVSKTSSEIDLTRLKEGNISEVVFYPSNVGGGVIMWYMLKNNELVRMSITIGTGLHMIEHVYAKNVPINEPGEEEIGFPKFPGATFKPLESSFFGNDPCMVNLLFTTNIAADEVISFFDGKLGPKTHFLEIGRDGFYVKKMDGFEFHIWPTLSVTHQPEMHSGDTVHPAFTSITYKYFIKE